MTQEILTPAYKRIQQAFCIFDIVSLGPLAVPLVNIQHLANFGAIYTVLGGEAWPSFSTIELLFLQMLGIVGVGWAVWRWRHLSRDMGIYEGVLRLLFAATLTVAAFQTGSVLISIFAAIDWIAGTLHVAGFKRSFSLRPVT